jgi:hypothetical protein
MTQQDRRQQAERRTAETRTASLNAHHYRAPQSTKKYSPSSHVNITIAGRKLTLAKLAIMTVLLAIAVTLIASSIQADNTFNHNTQTLNSIHEWRMANEHPYTP